jgi:hypothetical protein
MFLNHIVKLTQNKGKNNPFHAIIPYYLCISLLVQPFPDNFTGAVKKMNKKYTKALVNISMI